MRASVCVLLGALVIIIVVLCVLNKMRRYDVNVRLSQELKRLVTGLRGRPNTNIDVPIVYINLARSKGREKHFLAQPELSSPTFSMPLERF